MSKESTKTTNVPRPQMKRLLGAKTVPTSLLQKDNWYIGLYAGSKDWVSVKFWDGERWNRTQNPNCEEDVFFEPKLIMEPINTLR